MHGQSIRHTRSSALHSSALANLNAGIQVNFIQERGTKPHFSHMFVFSSAHSCCVRDAFQALKRVRQFGSPELYYCLDTLSSPKERRLLCTTLEAAGRHVKRMAWLQEHYCGEQVCRTEEDILEQVLAFDPEDDVAAAQRLRAMKEQLCMARQQGMPAWLADVHSHTILESDLSKGYHEECFDLFLMMNAYISQNFRPGSHEQGEEEPLGLAGVMEATGPEPASPQNTLAQGNPGYAVVASLEPKVAAELQKQLHKGQDGDHMEQPVNMLLEKFHFDRRVNCSDAAMEDRALVFDEMCASSFKKERFLRMYHEVNNSGASLAEINLPGNQYLGMWEKLPATVGAMHQLCALLGVSSSQDLEAEFPAAQLVGKADQLAPVIGDLQTLCNIAGAKAVHRTSQAKDLKTAISQILTFCSNTKLRSQRGQARQRNSRSDNYTYAITIKQIKTLPDPFTKAVIELLKSQAPAAVDFLPETM